MADHQLGPFDHVPFPPLGASGAQFYVYIPRWDPSPIPKKKHGSLHGTHFGGGSNLMLMSGNSEGFPLKMV